MPASVQPPVIEIGPLTLAVPFHRSLYVAETTLTENINFTPRKGTGTPAALKPILGAKVFYRVTGDGLSYPTFSSDFVKTRESLNFNRDAGVVNLITFTFDGNVFNYTITPEVIGVEYPRWVGNFGIEGDQMVLVAHTDAVGVIQDTTPPVCTRSAFNLIKSLHYVGENPLMFDLSEDGLTWTSDPDPKKAMVEFVCSEVGARDLYVRVRADNQLIETATPPAKVTITVTDTEGYC